ncbi:PGF-pre-PGF domain-containing protein [Candidatus Woesearchaeota archaeon]|nr:PGF-pre-PGF domain-containing protein [Candidatus Woesearchaeota archaeon]
MKKEGRTNIKFISSVIFFSLVMIFLVMALDISINAPSLGAINSSTRNINFTFTPTWDLPGEVKGNCSLWTNFSGSWESAIEFNGTRIDPHNVSSNITNASTSWVNYTFAHDLSYFVWDIGCRNGTGEATVLTFNGSNRSISVDTSAPQIVQTADIFAGFNTSDATPTITVNFTDVNGTGMNFTTTGNLNLSLNVTLYDVNEGADSVLKSYNLSNGSLTCSPSNIDSAQSVQCTLDVSTFPLTNGTKNITVAVTDRAGLTSNISFLFTVDNIPPTFAGYVNFTNASSFNIITRAGAVGDNVTATQLGVDGNGNVLSLDQGMTIYGVANLSDNLTRPLQGRLQFYNISASSWQTLNNSPAAYLAFNNGSMVNFSFPIPLGHSVFEGKNVSFRIIANDTLGNSNVTDVLTTKNFTIQINDTTVPTIVINGSVAVNGTNITDTTPLISWSVIDNSGLISINVSVDKTLPSGTGIGDGCTKSAFYTDTATGDDNVETGDGGRGWRNGSFTISSTATCPLSNGTHFVEVTAIDKWNNMVVVFNNFTIESGAVPTITLSNLQNGLSAVNNSNVTSTIGINFTAVGGQTSKMRNFTWSSSCNSTTIVISSAAASFTAANLTYIYPFNLSRCPDSSMISTPANRTVTLTVADDAGNEKTETWTFFVDNLGPTLSVNAPTNGFSGSNNITINLSAKDSIQKIGGFGYYIDGQEIFRSLNLSAGIGNSATNTTNVFYLNFTPGTHTIKFTANDTLGNAVNSSTITFTAVGPIRPFEINQSIKEYLDNNIIADLTINLSFRLKDPDGNFRENYTELDSGSTFEIVLHLNNSQSNGANMTITELNGSKANWDKINFSVLINNTKFNTQVEQNFSATLFTPFVLVNASFEEFISNSNEYFGIVELPFNISGSTPTAQQIWYFPNSSKLTESTDRTNVTQCTSAFIKTSTTPCWNYSTGGRTKVFVPHFSGVGIGNDTTKPWVNVTYPSNNQTVGSFIPNITVSSDTVSCVYSVNSTGTNVTMTKTGNVCIGTVTNFANLGIAPYYNITFNVTDSSGNINTYFWNFTVTDSTSPGTSGSITSSPSTTSATVTVSANETVNATVRIANGSTISGNEVDFATSQTVTISGLTASTTYHFNVTICDFNGNCLINATSLSLTTSAAAAASSTSTSSSSSGSSGGGGAAVASTEAASTSKKWDSLDAGASAVLTINNANIAVTGVVVDVKNAVTSAEVKVASLTTNPISSAAAGKVYQYLQLTKSNIADSDASKITISFKVPKSWLSTNSVSEDDVVLYRYSDSKWNALPTSKAGTDANNVMYSATTPGFSTFAIGNKEAAPAAAEQPAEGAPAAEAPTVPGETPTAAGEKPAGEAAMEKKGLSTTAIAWIVVVVIVVAAGVGYFMWQKKKAE